MMSSMYYRWRVENFLERQLVWLVWRLPRKVIYWAAVRLMTADRNGEYKGNPADRMCGDALRSWEKGTNNNGKGQHSSLHA